MSAEDSVNNFWDTQNLAKRVKILEELVNRLKSEVEELKELHP